MKLSKNNAAIVRNVLDGWVKEGALTQKQWQQLQKQVEVQPFDWRRLARYGIPRGPGLAGYRLHQPY